MGKTSNAVKQKWNEEHYKQIKIMVSPELAQSFKSACVEAGQTMNAVLSKYIEGVTQTGLAKTVPSLHIMTRPQRRKSLRLLLDKLRELRDAEYCYQENVPENLHGGKRYEQSEESIERLDEAISLLDEAF